jgi:N-acetylglucosaminyl-diphospho-decaprenol L-rhamnosyltransferase
MSMDSGAAHSLVVVTWESRQDLSRLLDSMLAHLDPRHELVVVDNASGDEPERELGRWPGPTRYQRLESNRGFGAAANAGVALASSEGIVLLNPDVELLDGGLAALADGAVESGALVGPRLLNPDGTPQPSASGPVIGVWPWLGALVPGAVQPGPVRARTEPWRLDHRVEVTWLTGACIAAPRGVLAALGPFDERIELMSEDLDLCLRAGARGIPVVFAPRTCRLVHHGGSARERRFEDAGLALAARNRRAAIARAYGPSRERRGWRAQVLRLRLRAAAKGALRRDRRAEQAELAAARAAASYEPI